MGTSVAGLGLNALTPNELYPLTVSRDDFRKEVFVLQASMMALPEEFKFESPLKHTFCNGIYAREMTIPAGITIVGAIHKFRHISTISKGVIDVMSEFGLVRYEAPITFISEAMIKRVVSAVEETVWTTYHATDKTDVDEIVKDITVEDYSMGGEV